MENVELKEGYSFRIFGNKTFAVENGRDEIVYCPFCYKQALASDSKCGVCNKNIPESIYFHSDDQTWIASGNETVEEASPVMQPLSEKPETNKSSTKSRKNNNGSFSAGYLVAFGLLGLAFILVLCKCFLAAACAAGISALLLFILEVIEFIKDPKGYIKRRFEQFFETILNVLGEMIGQLLIYGFLGLILVLFVYCKLKS